MPYTIPTWPHLSADVGLWAGWERVVVTRVIGILATVALERRLRCRQAPPSCSPRRLDVLLPAEPPDGRPLLLPLARLLPLFRLPLAGGVVNHSFFCYVC